MAKDWLTVPINLPIDLLTRAGCHQASKADESSNNPDWWDRTQNVVLRWSSISRKVRAVCNTRWIDSSIVADQPKIQFDFTCDSSDHLVDSGHDKPWWIPLAFRRNVLSLAEDGAYAFRYWERPDHFKWSTRNKGNERYFAHSCRSSQLHNRSRWLEKVAWISLGEWREKVETGSRIWWIRRIDTWL